MVSALYLRRFQRKVVLIHSGKPRAAWIPRTHNLIGYEHGISGAELLQRLRRQVTRLGLEWVKGEATVNRSADGKIFEIDVDSKKTFRAKTVILAAGVKDYQPQIENLLDLREAGLLRYCSICDAYEFRQKPLCVLAQDEEGIDRALFIHYWSRDVTILLPEGYRLAEKRKRELREAGVRVIFHRRLEMSQARTPKGLHVLINGETCIYFRVAYIELGCSVNDSAFATLQGLARTPDGFLITDSEQRLSIPGMFAVGDCVNQLGQISVAAGQAAIAATTIHNDLLY